MSERERRIGLNEAAFREVNEAVRSIGEQFDAPDLEIVCECGSIQCHQRIPVTAAEYETVRGVSDQFAVIHGHEQPDVEQVIAEREHYVVVRKIGDASRQLARETDSRARDA
jgi:hypothetical protein